MLGRSQQPWWPSAFGPQPSEVEMRSEGWRSSQRVRHTESGAHSVTPSRDFQFLAGGPLSRPLHPRRSSVAGARKRFGLRPVRRFSCPDSYLNSDLHTSAAGGSPDGRNLSNQEAFWGRMGVRKRRDYDAFGVLVL